jgi:hypothetical protein
MAVHIFMNSTTHNERKRYYHHTISEVNGFTSTISLCHTNQITPAINTLVAVVSFTSVDLQTHSLLALKKIFADLQLISCKSIHFAMIYAILMRH